MKRAAWLAQQRGRKAVLYVIRVYNKEGEAFYKVGITFCFSSRFSRLKTVYRFRTLARYSSYHAGAVYDLEQRLHREFVGLSYTPTASFSGYTECYRDAEPILASLPQETFFLKGGVDI
ncbi:MAG: GIY-YIG nuclease family protein [Janthinobacterium lividum]